MKEKMRLYVQLESELSSILREAIQRSGHTQKRIAEMCYERGINISQTTISTVMTRKRPVSIEKMLGILEVLEVDIFQKSKVIERLTIDNVNSYKYIGSAFENLVLAMNTQLVVRPDDMHFNGLEGDYHTYFLSTNKNENKLLKGIMSIKKMGNYCKVDLSLRAEKREDLFSKMYSGFLIVSAIQNVAYSILINAEIGEICYFCFKNDPILNKQGKIACKFAVAATVSAGIDERLPTMHRLFFCRKELNEEELRVIKAQLQLNMSEIIISEEQWEDLLKSEEVSEDFINMFYQKAKVKKYHVVNEAELLPDEVLVKKWLRELSILREYSMDQINNKVSSVINTQVFHKYMK